MEISIQNRRGKGREPRSKKKRAEKQERWTGRVGYSGQKKQIACLRLAGRGIVRHDQHR